MKKLMLWICAVVVLAGTSVFAETEQKTFSLSEYLGITELGDCIKTVKLTTDNAGTASMMISEEIEPERFIEIADGIILTDVENEEMYYGKDGHTGIDWSGVYIEVMLDESKTDERMRFAYVTKDGKVDRYSMMMSRLPAADCIMSEEDVRKLTDLFESSNQIASGDVQTQDVEAVQIQDVEAVQTQDAAAVQKQDAENADPTITGNTQPIVEKKSEYKSAALAVVAGVLVAVVAVTAKMTSKK